VLAEPEEAAEESEDAVADVAEVADTRVEPAPRRAPTPTPVAAVQETPERALPAQAERDPELGTFRRAHDLHFKAAVPRAAVAAYAEYLNAYPHGRYVPEARYNTAVKLLKLGERGRARNLLESFARGDHGAYRQTEAKELLEAMAR
jgi:TolA-binding protein